MSSRKTRTPRPVQLDQQTIERIAAGEALADPPPLIALGPGLSLPPGVPWPDESEPTELIRLAVVDLPIAPLGDGYLSQRLDGRLSVRQAELLERLRRGLDAANATVPNASNQHGRVITTSDAFRWLLEYAADALDETESLAQE